MTSPRRRDRRLMPELEDFVHIARGPAMTFCWSSSARVRTISWRAYIRDMKRRIASRAEGPSPYLCPGCVLGLLRKQHGRERRDHRRWFQRFDRKAVRR